MDHPQWEHYEGQQVDKYRLRQLLGAHRLSAVYLAHHLLREQVIRRVAVRVMVSDSMSEGPPSSVLAALQWSHPHVISLLDAGQARLDGYELIYLVEELAEYSLAHEWPNRPLTGEKAADIARQIADALQFLHQEGQPHGSLTPHNVLCTRAAWKVADVGLRPALWQSDPARLRAELVQNAYLPPEAYGGMVTPAWDMWAFGIILTEMFQSHDPEWEEAEQDFAHRKMARRQPLPSPFREIANRCLHPDPTQRVSAAQVVEWLQNQVEPAHEAESPARPPTRWPEPVAAVAPATPEPVWTPTPMRAAQAVPEPVRAAPAAPEPAQLFTTAQWPVVTTGLAQPHSTPSEPAAAPWGTAPLERGTAPVMAPAAPAVDPEPVAPAPVVREGDGLSSSGAEPRYRPSVNGGELFRYSAVMTEAPPKADAPTEVGQGAAGYTGIEAQPPSEPRYFPVARAMPFSVEEDVEKRQPWLLYTGIVVALLLLGAYLVGMARETEPEQGSRPVIIEPKSKPAKRPDRSPISSPQAASTPAAERPSPVVNAPSPTVAPAAATAGPPTREQAQAGITSTLTHWVDTTRRHDLDNHIQTYGPRLSNFFKQKGVSQQYVRTEKARLFREYPEIRQFEISNLRLQSLKGNEAVVTFDKRWDTVGKSRYAGAGQGRMRLQLINAQWKIVGEEDTRVYWSKRS